MTCSAASSQLEHADNLSRFVVERRAAAVLVDIVDMPDARVYPGAVLVERCHGHCECQRPTPCQPCGANSCIFSRFCLWQFSKVFLSLKCVFWLAYSSLHLQHHSGEQGTGVEGGCHTHTNQHTVPCVEGRRGDSVSARHLLVCDNVESRSSHAASLTQVGRARTIAATAYLQTRCVGGLLVDVR